MYGAVTLISTRSGSSGSYRERNHFATRVRVSFLLSDHLHLASLQLVETECRHSFIATELLTSELDVLSSHEHNNVMSNQARAKRSRKLFDIRIAKCQHKFVIFKEGGWRMTLLLEDTDCSGNAGERHAYAGAWRQWLHVPRILFSPTPIFPECMCPGTYLHRYLSCPIPIFHNTYLPRHLSCPIPIFHNTYLPRHLSSSIPIFPIPLFPCTHFHLRFALR